MDANPSWLDTLVLDEPYVATAFVPIVQAKTGWPAGSRFRFRRSLPGWLDLELETSRGWESLGCIPDGAERGPWIEQFLSAVRAWPLVRDGATDGRR